MHFSSTLNCLKESAALNRAFLFLFLTKPRTKREKLWKYLSFNCTRRKIIKCRYCSDKFKSMILILSRILMLLPNFFQDEKTLIFLFTFEQRKIKWMSIIIRNYSEKVIFFVKRYTFHFLVGNKRSNWLRV